MRHPRKTMLSVILNRLQPQVKEIIAEEQAVFIAGRSTTEQIFNQSQDPLRKIPAASAESLLCLHRLQQGLWQGMVRNLMGNYEEIQHQHEHHTSHYKAQSAVLFNDSTGDWFRTTVGVRQGCLLSPTLVNIFLQRIMCEAMKVVSASEDDLLPTSALQMTLLSMQTRRRSQRPGRLSWFNNLKVQNGDWFRQDESDDKHPKWLPKRDQDKRSEARTSG